jgi:hypothetical protein
MCENIDRKRANTYIATRRFGASSSGKHLGRSDFEAANLTPIRLVAAVHVDTVRKIAESHVPRHVDQYVLCFEIVVNHVVVVNKRHCFGNLDRPATHSPIDGRQRILFRRQHLRIARSVSDSNSKTHPRHLANKNDTRRT